MTGGLYLEIAPPERLVFVHGATGGWPALDPDNVSDNPLVTLTLTAEAGGRTAMTLDVRLPDTMSDERAAEWMATGMPDGWGQTIDRLVAAMR